MRKQVLTLVAGLFVAGIVNAVTVSTDPVGFITLTIKGTDTSDGLSAVSVPMLSSSLHSGVVYEVTGSTITDSNGSWATGDFATADPNGNPSHYIEITNHTDSTKVGVIYEITGSDGGNKTLTIASDAAGLAGASYSVRKSRTLGDIFGDANESGLTAGSSSAADIIYKVGIDGTGALAWQIYYYQEAPIFAGGDGWRQLGKSASSDMKDVGVFPDEGLIIKRRSGSDVAVTLTGSVKTSNSRTAIQKGFNLVSLSYPVDSSLENIGLYNTDGTLLTSGSSSTADRIYYVNDQGQFDIFYYQEAPVFAGGNGWRKLGASASTDQKDSVIPAGRSIVVLRRADTGIDWATNVPF
jgi:uncharacterized protein (TIGR02597 family)